MRKRLYQDVEKVLQLRSRIAQGLNVPPGKSCQSSSGRVGEKKLRLGLWDTGRSPTRVRPQT